MPLLWLSIAFLVGIITAKITAFNWPIWTGVTAGCIGFLILELKKLGNEPVWLRLRSWIPVPIALIPLLFTLGGLRYSAALSHNNPSQLAYYNDRGTFTLTGVVSAPPDRREDAVYLEISVREMVDPQEGDPLKAVKTLHGNARVRLPAAAAWEYGDVLRFSAKPLTPDGDGSFSYKEYLERQRIRTVIYFPQRVELVEKGKIDPILLALEKLRLNAQKTIFRQIPQPESGLLSGILLGLDKDLPQNLKQAYQQTGTAHIIAISGFNMAVLAGLFTTLFTRLSNRYWAAAMTLIALAGYAVFVGGSPSVVRAAIMSVAALGGHLIGRRQLGLNSLFLTAALMCIVNPLLIWDVSFQLSFAATLGLVLFAGHLKEWLEERLAKHLPEEKVLQFSKPLSEYLLFTLAAQVTTLPVIAIHFGRISLSSLLANPLILPVQPPILILGGISTIAGMIFPWLGKIIALLVWVPMRYTNAVVELLAKLKGASLAVHPQVAVWILVTLVIFVILFVFDNYFKKIFSKWFTWIVFLLVIASMAAWSIFAHLPDGKLHIQLMENGDDSTLVIHDPQGKVIVFDPGKSVNELSAEISRQLSPWDFSIDEVWHTRRASVSSLELFQERIPISKSVLTPAVYMAGADQRPLRVPQNIELVKLAPGGEREYPSGMLIRLAGEEQDRSALFIEYGEIRILVPNGVDYALIRETSPALLGDLTMVILQEEDLSYIPPRVWQALEPQIILWNSTALSPSVDWPGNDVNRRISISTDGHDFWVDSE